MNATFDYSLIGLNGRDKRVYEALISSPNGSVRAVANATNINRGSVHESIKKLTEIGLVGFYETGNQRHYKAQDPSVLTELIAEKKQQLEGAMSSSLRYIEMLVKLQQTNPKESFATFYEDDDGIAAILRDVLSSVQKLPNKEYCAISSQHVREYLYRNFSNFTKKRIQQKIFVRVIAIGQGGQSDDTSERRWLVNYEGAPPNCYTIMYGHKTAFISLNEANVPLGIVIDNAGVTAMQQALFEQTWQQLKTS